MEEEACEIDVLTVVPMITNAWYVTPTRPDPVCTRDARDLS